MPAKKSVVRGIFAVTLSVVALAACGSSKSPLGYSTADAGGSDGSIASNGDAATFGSTSLTIMPANPTLTSSDGTMPTQAFALTSVNADGTMTELANGAWSIDDARYGVISSAGTFTANGAAGGTATITATVGALTATTTITVNVTRVLNGTSDPNIASKFAAATAGGTPATLLYPLEGAFMPNNVAAPDVQWSGGASGDDYRITITKPHLTVTNYVTNTGAAFTYDWLVATTAWQEVAESDPGASITLTVDLLATATDALAAGTPLHFTLSKGSVYGSVYYWAVDQGHLWRINADTSAREDFLPNPPDGNGGTGSCVACHKISHNGRYLFATLDNSGGPSALIDLTKDLTTNPAPAVYTEQGPGLVTFSPTDTDMVSISGTSAGIYDVASGMLVDTKTLPSTSALPAWSADGTTLAFVGNISGSIAGTNHWSYDDLFVLGVTGSSGAYTFGTPTRLAVGSDYAAKPEGGTAFGHPTWSPDSQRLVFQHGLEPFSQFGAAADGSEPTLPTPGALYITTRDGATQVRLDNANGGATGQSAFWPAFSPFTTTDDGVTRYWLAFYSQRPYGNAQVGTLDKTLLNADSVPASQEPPRQLWVTAVRSDTLTVDPSSVPYWMPGQDTASDNAAAQWAVAACRTNGESCEVTSQCCSGNCLAGDGGTNTCQSPSASACHNAGQTCGGSGDCCAGLTCVGNVCDDQPK